MILTAAVLLAFFRCLSKRLSPDADRVAIGAGVGIAGLWLFVRSGSQSAPLNEVAPGLGPMMLLVWVVFRLVGTAVLVPIVEELFSRGYLMKRMSGLPGFDPDSGRALGVLASLVLFAIVHDAFVLAFFVALCSARSFYAEVACGMRYSPMLLQMV